VADWRGDAMMRERAGASRTATWQVADGFQLDAFLGRALVARLATRGQAGPTVRPIWYLWEDQRFWWLTGSWSKLERVLSQDSRVALVVDSCDLNSGEILQVNARGSARLEPFDADRARRWGARYLGSDERHWGRFRTGVFDNPSSRFIVLDPGLLTARDLSF
jgi:hypothetical protein